MHTTTKLNGWHRVGLLLSVLSVASTIVGISLLWPERDEAIVRDIAAPACHAFLELPPGFLPDEPLSSGAECKTLGAFLRANNINLKSSAAYEKYLYEARIRLAFAALCVLIGVALISSLVRFSTAGSNMRSHLKVACFAAAGVVAVQVVVGLLVYFAIPDWPTRGQFGDLFGIVNATFSGLAFAGIVYSLRIQRDEFASNAASSEASARMAAMSVLVTAYTERARHLDSRASPDANKVEGIHAKLKELIIVLEAEVERSTKRGA